MCVHTRVRGAIRPPPAAAGSGDVMGIIELSSRSDPPRRCPAEGTAISVSFTQNPWAGLSGGQGDSKRLMALGGGMEMGGGDVAEATAL